MLEMSLNYHIGNDRLSWHDATVTIVYDLLTECIGYAKGVSLGQQTGIFWLLLLIYHRVPAESHVMKAIAYTHAPLAVVGTTCRQTTSI